MGVIETSRKRSAEEAGTRGGTQPDPGSMADESMHEAMWDARTLGADAVTLALRTRQQGSSSRGDGSALGMGSWARG